MAGESVMTLGRRMPYAGSLAEQAVQSGQPAIIERIAEADERLPPDLVTACADCSAAVVPLDGSGEPIVMVALPSASRSARTGTRPDRGAWAAVHVTDTGPGISSEQVKHLFEEFSASKPLAKPSAPASALPSAEPSLACSAGTLRWIAR